MSPFSTERGFLVGPPECGQKKVVEFSRVLPFQGCLDLESFICLKYCIDSDEFSKCRLDSTRIVAIHHRDKFSTAAAAE